MTLPIIVLTTGLILLVWSADRFVEGAASAARCFGVPPLLIGMVIVGFGTSAPEMIVSALGALNGSLGIALGNAYGSNIANIALILGITALINPVMVHSTVLRKELPILTLATALTVVLIADLYLSKFDAAILLFAFASLMVHTVYKSIKKENKADQKENTDTAIDKQMSIKKACFWLVAGLFLLICSSRLLVWGAIEIAQIFGISDMVIGLTVVAVGTSLPELASSVIAARKGEHDIALGNILGSNLFNTLAVVGVAATIHPFKVDPEILNRDILIMTALTLSIFVFGCKFRGKQGCINRFEGTVLLLVYLAYTTYLITTVL